RCQSHAVFAGVHGLRSADRAPRFANRARAGLHVADVLADPRHSHRSLPREPGSRRRPLRAAAGIRLGPLPDRRRALHGGRGMSGTENPTACVLLIGNELLSGKTQDANLKFIGGELARIGIRLEEARVIRDEIDAIVAHVNECRARYTYVFTTGGIGPTHDDITAEAVAKAFDVDLVVDPEAVVRLKHGGRELNEARLKMARVPEGAELIENPISAAPGFRIENVYVLAGIPPIAHAMFAAAEPMLRRGRTIHARGIDVFLREGDFALELERIARAHPEVEIG